MCSRALAVHFMQHSPRLCCQIARVLACLPVSLLADAATSCPTRCTTQDIFKYIARHRPAPLEQLPMRLMPFIPEYIPAVGGTDEFIKVPRPDGQPDYLGLKVC